MLGCTIRRLVRKLEGGRRAKLLAATVRAARHVARRRTAVIIIDFCCRLLPQSLRDNLNNYITIRLELLLAQSI